MTTTSFSESLKYGGRLFGFFLAVILLAGSFLGLGGYLTATEGQAVLGSGSVETAPLAGGLVLTALGVTTLIIGHFAMAYKLVADGVSRGTANAQAVVEMGVEDQSEAETSDPPSSEDSELGPSPGEQTARDHGPEQTVPSGADGDPPATDTAGRPPVETTGGAESAEATVERPSQPPTAQAQQSPAESDGEQDQQPAESGREQTAEEIAFGTGESRERTRQDDQPRGAPAEEPTDSAGTGDTQAAMPAEPDDGVPAADEEPEHTPEEPVEEPPAEDIETAGDASSDPLADKFDDE